MMCLGLHSNSFSSATLPDSASSVTSTLRSLESSEATPLAATHLNLLTLSSNTSTVFFSFYGVCVFFFSF